MSTIGKDQIYKKFYKIVRWNIVGSLAFELLKMSHQLALFHTLDTTLYGHLGWIFSTLFLTITFSSIGAELSLTPFLKTFLQSKQSFKRLFIPIAAFQAVPMSIGALVTTYMYRASQLYSTDSPYISIIFLLITLEGLRSFMRSFLHCAFYSKQTVLVELALFIGYLLLIWIPYLFFQIPITLNQLLGGFLATSFISLFFFFLLSVKIYKDLKIEKSPARHKDIFWGIFKTRIFTYGIKITKQLFSGNFMVALFAFRFGLYEAGLFKIASYIADAFKGISNSAIGYSGSALLAHTKGLGTHEGQRSFRKLSEKLSAIIYFSSIFILINYKSIPITYSRIYSPSLILLITLTLILNTFIEQTIALYEQFYIAHENSYKLLLFKLFELLFFYMAIFWVTLSSPIITLASFSLIRTLSLVVITLDAYSTWQIKPHYKLPARSVLIYSSVSLLFYIAKTLLLP